MKNIVTRRIPIPLLTLSVTLREVRAAMPAVIGCVIVQMIFPLVKILVNAIEGNAVVIIPEQIALAWSVGMTITCLILGVLCGAEEAENGTADFARRLPISPLRILSEKILGCCIAFCIWAALASLFDSLIGSLFCTQPNSFFFPFIHGTVSPGLFSHALFYGPLLFCFGLAAGVWIEKVLIAAIVGGIGVFIYNFLPLPEMLNIGGIPQAVWLGCLLALIATYIRYQTREGT